MFRKLRQTYPHVSLTILGKLNSHVSIYEKKVIIHKDFVSYGELLEHYASHDVLVHVPPVVEGYGMSVPEAMSYGMCPIVSNICALPEFVEDGKSGLVVQAGSEEELYNALKKVITDATLRRRLQQGARKRFLQQFSLPVFHKQLLKLFQTATSYFAAFKIRFR